MLYLKKYAKCLFWAPIITVVLWVSQTAHANEDFTKTPVSNFPIKAHVQATLSADHKTLTGQVTLRIRNNTQAPLTAIPLWLYPNRFNKLSPGLTDRTLNWIYPKGKSLGNMTVENAKWNNQAVPNNAIKYQRMAFGPSSIQQLSSQGNNGDANSIERAIAKIPLSKPLTTGQTGVLKIEFSVQIPNRRGRFGRYKGTVSLGSGWFPRPLADLTGKNIALPPDTMVFSGEITLPKQRGAVVNHLVFPKQAASQVLKINEFKAAAVSLVVLKVMDIHEQQFPFGKAYYVSSHIAHTRPSWKRSRQSDAHGLPQGLPNRGHVENYHRAFSVLEKTVHLLKAYNPELDIQQTLTIVEIPAYDKLVQSGPGALLVSNRIWKILAFERVLSFHDIAIAKGLAKELLLKSALTHLAPKHRYIVAEMIAEQVGADFAETVYGGVKSVRELVKFAAFIPYIDNLMYAPQVPFRESYSLSISDPDPLRDEPWRFMNQLPGGKRINAKLIDLIGSKQLRTSLNRGLNQKKSFPHILETTLGPKQAARFFKQWFGVYPKVNYKISAVNDTPTDTGEIKHTVSIARIGENIVEPVAVQITDKSGATQTVIWNGEGQTGRVSWVSAQPIKNVVLDPKARLVEAPELAEDHPTADNSKPLGWRPPMITQLLVWGDVVALEPFFTLGLALRRKYDVTNSFHLNGAYTPRSFGGSFGYLRHFGPKRTLNARVWYMGPTASIFRYQEVQSVDDDTFPEDTLFSATLGSVGILIGRDDRSYMMDPRRGVAFNLFGGYSGGRSTDGDPVHAGNFSGRVFKLFPLAAGHTLAIYGGSQSVVGHPPAAKLPSLSSRNILKGFELDETYGRLGFYTAMEYRHRLMPFSHVSMYAQTSLERLQGVFFSGIGTQSHPKGYGGLFSSERIFAEVGYGIRLHLFAFGISQYLLAFDVAFPILPTNRTYTVTNDQGGTTEYPRQPFKLMFGITQTY